MTRYWTIWPYHPDDPETLDRAWQYDLKNGVIAIGWNLGGHVATASVAELNERIAALWPGEPTAASMLWKFYNEITLGDMIVAIRRRTEFVGVGSVAGSAFYDEHRGRERVGRLRDFKANFIPVIWRARGRWISSTLLPRQTLAEIGHDKYIALIRKTPLAHSSR
jgi:hypothetical protein